QMRADLERIMTASRESLKGLMSLVEDGECDSETRRKACWFLGRLADAQAVDVLKRVLLDTGAEYEVRVEAAQALSYMPSARTLPALSGVATSDAPVVVRDATVWALGRLGDRRAVPLLIDLLQREEEDPHLRGSAA